MSKPKIKWVSIGSPEHVDIERRFDEATGGAPRLIESAEKAGVETDILRHKLKRQREIIEKIIKSAPWSNEKASSFLVLDNMLITAMRLGALELTNDKREKLEESRAGSRQTAVARDARSKKPEELALMAAIHKARGDGPVAKSTKEAGSILSQVNDDLEKAGFAPVKIDVVRRRLEKFPRS